MSQFNALSRHNVRLDGRGEVTIVFGHGYGCDQTVWRRVSPAFHAKFRTAVFDYVGAGGSRAEFDAHRYRSLGGYAADLLEVCQACGPGPVVFVGHSVSAMIGILAAKREPERFLRLVLLAPSPRYINDTGYTGGFTEGDIDALLDLLGTDHEKWAATLAPIIMGNPERPELARELAETFCRMDPAIARHFAEVTFRSDSRADLAHVQARTLILQCSEDVIAPAEVGDYLRRHLPNAELVKLAATGHCPHLSAPDEVSAAIKAFLSDLSPVALKEDQQAPPSFSGESAEELYENAPCGYVSYLLDSGMILRVNQTFANWTGHAASEITGGARFQDLLSPAGRIVYETRMMPLLRLQGIAEAVPMELACPGKDPLPVLLSATLKTEASGQPSLIRATALNAAAYRRYEQELIQAREHAERAEAEARQAQAAAEAANASKTRFLSAMNHEFRTPISIISGFSELLLDQPENIAGTEAWRVYLEDINAAAEHLLELLEDATRYAKLEVVEPARGRRRVDVQALTRAGLRIAGAMLKKSDMDVIVAVPPDHSACIMDRGLVAEAIACVLREIARRAMPGSVTEITSRMEQDCVWIDIDCKALQLSPSARAGLEAPLHAPDLYSRGLEGAGLGIAVADRVLRTQGGRILIDPHPGGTSLMLSLPIC